MRGAMKLNVAICDDDPHQIENLKAVVRMWAKNRGHFCEIASFPGAEAFLFEYSENKTFDILLLDIEMGGINGVELARAVRVGNETVQIVFITGFPDFIAEGYDVGAVQYLLKPAAGERIVATLDRAVKNLGKKEKTVLIETDGISRILEPSKILYVESFAHESVIRLVDEKIRCKIPLVKLEQTLGGQFVHCHRSYLVGLHAIRSITKTDVILDNGERLPISRRMYAQLSQAFISYYKGEPS